MSVDLVGFLAVVLAAYVVPGPDFPVVVRSAAEHPSLGRAAALGAQTGLCVHMFAAVAGLSVIAAHSHAGYDGIKFRGAAHLVHLGVRAVLAARRGAAHGAARRGSGPEAEAESGAPAGAAMGGRARAANRRPPCPLQPGTAHQPAEPEGGDLLPQPPAAVRRRRRFDDRADSLPKTGVADVPTWRPDTSRPTIAASWGESAPNVWPNQADRSPAAAASAARAKVASI